MRTTSRELIAGTAASAAFVGLAAGTGMAWWFALPLGAAVYAAARLMLPAVREPERDELAPGVTRRQVENAAAGVAAIAARFERAAALLPPGGMSERIRAIGRTVLDMAANFRNDPADLNLAQDFLAFQLPKALSIVERYAQLSAQPNLDDEARSRLQAAEHTIEAIERAFARQYRSFLEQDFRDFQVDQRVFHELLALDGLEDGDAPRQPAREPQEEGS